MGRSKSSPSNSPSPIFLIYCPFFSKCSNRPDFSAQQDRELGCWCQNAIVLARDLMISSPPWSGFQLEGFDICPRQQHSFSPPASRREAGKTKEKRALALVLSIHTARNLLAHSGPP